MMLPGRRAVEVDETDFARHVDQRVDRQLAGDQPRRLDRVLRLSATIVFQFADVRPIDRHGDDLLVRRVAIGQQVQRAVDDAERIVGRGVAGIQRAHRRVELRRDGLPRSFTNSSFLLLVPLLV